MTTTIQPPISASSFRTWLARAEPCTSLEYHRGFLSRDRSPVSDLNEQHRRALAETADVAFRAAEDGRVHLVQSRHGPFDYSYLAITVRGAPSLAETATALVQKQVAVSSPAEQQLSLPPSVAHLLADLPASFRVPVAGANPDDDQAVCRRPLAGRSGITVAEAQTALILLEGGIAADERRARAVREALDIARAAGANPITRLADALARAPAAA